MRPTESKAAIAILAAGHFSRKSAKTAIGVLRYAANPVVAVIDPTKAGTTAAQHVGTGEDVPVVATVSDAVERGATVVLVGTASPGGRLPDDYRPYLRDALLRGMEVWSGLHERVLDDPELMGAAQRSGHVFASYGSRLESCRSRDTLSDLANPRSC